MSKSRVIRKKTGDVLPEASPEKVNLSEVLSFLARAKTLVEDAKKHDGVINEQEAAEIFNKLIPDLEKIGGKRIRGQVQQARERYNKLIFAIDSFPALSVFLRNTYPNFFGLFSTEPLVHKETPDAAAPEAAAPEAAAPEAAPAPERRDISSDDWEKLLNFVDSVRQYRDLLNDPKARKDTNTEFSEEVLHAFQSDVDRVRKTLDAEVFEIARILARAERDSDTSLYDVVLAFQDFIEQNISPQEFIDRQVALEETGAGPVTVDRVRNVVAPHPDSWLWDETSLTAGGDLLYPDAVTRVAPVRRDLPSFLVPPGPFHRPSVRREMGVVTSPVPEVTAPQIPSPAQAPLASPETVWTRMLGWAKQKRGELEDLDVYRVHMKGEKTRAEMDGSSATLSRPAMFTGAILSAALSYSGGALFADLPRYMGQRHYTRVERDEISAAFKAALEERRTRESGAPESVGVKERAKELHARVFASRYLTAVQKRELLFTLKSEEDSFAGTTSPYDEHLNREVGRILENAIRTRISEEKVLKEATNMLFAVSGANFLRAPAYGAISLYERWSRLTRETPESKAGDRLRATVAGGFGEYWDKAKGKKGRLAQAAAWGTAARFVGMSATLVESVAASGFVGDLLHAWESKEAAYPSPDSDLSHQNIDEIGERVRHAKTESWTNVLPNVLTERRDEMLEPDSYTLSGEPDDASYAEIPEVPVGGGRVEIPEPNSSILPGESFEPGESDQNESIDDDFEPVSGAAADTFPDESSSDVEPVPEPVPEAEVVMSPDRIPQEALVTKGDGITQSLLSAVEARPELLGPAERGALNDDYTAALLMRRMAAKDGLLDYWISEKAIGELAIVPVYDEGIPHIAFLNPDTGTAYSVDELKKMGWLVKAPK